MVDANGNPKIFERHESKALERASESISAAPRSAFLEGSDKDDLTPSGDGGVPGLRPELTLAPFGSMIGVHGFSAINIDNDPELEIVTGASAASFGANSYWFVADWDVGTASFQTRWVNGVVRSFFDTPDILHIQAFDLSDHENPVAVVLYENHDLIVTDLRTQKMLHSQRLGQGFNSLSRGSRIRMVLADADNNGSIDFVVSHDDRIFLLDPSDFSTRSSYDARGASDRVFGNMDADGKTEVVFADGRIGELDGQGNFVESYRFEAGFGDRIELVDVTGDGISEIAGADDWYRIRMFDVTRNAILWEHRTSHDIAAFSLTYSDQDGANVLLYGDGQWGSVHALGVDAGTVLWSHQAPDSGVNFAQLQQLSPNTPQKLIFASGHNSTGSDHLYLVNRTTAKVEWKSEHESGPYRVVFTDSDEGGAAALHITSSERDSGYNGGLIHSFDASNLKPLWLESNPGQTLNIHSVASADVTGDGVAELILGGEQWYDGQIVLFDRQMKTRTLGYQFGSASVNQLNVIHNASGMAERVVAATYSSFSGGAGAVVHVLNSALTSELATSPSVSSSNSWGATGMVSSDIDGDGNAEIITTSGFVSVFDPDTRATRLTNGTEFSGIAHLKTTNGTDSRFYVGNKSGAVFRFDPATLETNFTAQVCASSVTALGVGELSIGPVLLVGCADGVVAVKLDDSSVIGQLPIVDPQNIAVKIVNSRLKVAVGGRYESRLFDLGPAKEAREKRTVIFIEGLTQTGQDMFLRGGIDWGYSSAQRGIDCSKDKWQCAIPIRHRLFTGHVQRANDHFLDWYGAESGQTGALGSPMVWTTNNPGNPNSVPLNGYGYTPLNTYGDHYWMLDVDMDCSKTVNGWFEVKSFIANGSGWEPNVQDPNRKWESGNHFAACGRVNVFRRGQSKPVEIRDFGPLKPVAKITAKQSFLVAESASFSGASSFDADGSIRSWLWQIPELNVTNDQQNFNFVFTNTGSYTVNLTVTDDTGRKDTATLTVKVVPAPTHANVQFTCLNGKTTNGYSVFIVGNTAELGNWSVKRQEQKLSVAGWPTWSKTLSVPANSTFQWKCVIANETTRAITQWESGADNTYTTGQSGSSGSTTGSF